MKVGKDLRFHFICMLRDSTRQPRLAVKIAHVTPMPTLPSQKAWLVSDNHSRFPQPSSPRMFQFLIVDYMFTPAHTYSPHPLFFTGSGVYCRQLQGLEFVNMVNYTFKHRTEIQRGLPGYTVGIVGGENHRSSKWFPRARENGYDCHANQNRTLSQGCGSGWR